MSSYGDLTEGEQAHWNEYTNLRQISDWPGFDDAQDDRRAYARAWLQDRRAQLWHDLNDEPIDEEANAANKRAQRYDFLKDENLNTGAPKHEVRLPCSGLATDTEKVYIEEREVYLAFGSTTDAQKARKQANVDWLVERRKSLWHLMEDEPEGNEANDRENRYDNLCIATHHGEAYEDWAATHNKWGEPEGGSSGTGRQAAMDHLDRRVGYTESPPDSNQDNRSDGIKTSDRSALVRVLVLLRRRVGRGQGHQPESGLGRVHRGRRQAGASLFSGMDDGSVEGAARGFRRDQRLRRARRDGARVRRLDDPDLRREHEQRLVRLAIQWRRRLRARA
jgi:hypothetical protein